MGDALGIVLIPAVAAECELGLLVVLKGNEALELTVGRYLAIGTFWYQQPMTKCPGTLYIEVRWGFEIKYAKLQARSRSSDVGKTSRDSPDK